MLSSLNSAQILESAGVKCFVYATMDNDVLKFIYFIVTCLLVNLLNKFDTPVLNI